MNRWGVFLAAGAAAAGAAVRLASGAGAPPEAPQVSAVSMVADRNGPVLIYGVGFGDKGLSAHWSQPRWPVPDKIKDEDYAALVRQSLERVLQGKADWGPAPEAKDRGWWAMKVQDEHVAVGHYPHHLKEGVAILRVARQGQVSRPVAVNRPELWGLSPRRPTPEEVVTAWGPNLGAWFGLVDGAGRVAAVVKGYQGYTDHSGRPEARFVRLFQVPADLAPGAYRVYAHNGDSDAGWSAPKPLWVQAPAGPPATVVNVRDTGAKADGFADDTEAVEKALVRAAAGAPGVVFFPPGRYVVSRSIRVPEGVTLRGASREACVIEASRWRPLDSSAVAGVFGRHMPLVYMPTSARLEDLTLEVTDGRGLRSSSAEGVPIVLVRGGQGPGPVIRRCRLMGQSSAMYRVWPDRRIVMGCLVWEHTEDLVFEGNEVVVTGMAFSTEEPTVAPRIRLNVFRQHDIHSHNSAFGLTLHREALIEGNRWEDTGRGVTQSSHNCFRWAVRHNLYLHNSFRNLRKSDGEIIYYETGGSIWDGRLERIEGRRLTLAGRPDLAKLGPTHPDKDNVLPQHTLFICEGRGLGQWREIVKAQGSTLEVAEPFGVEPDAASHLVILAGAVVENLHVGNEYFDSHQWVGIYGAGLRNAWVNEVYERVTGGTDLWKIHGVRQMSLNLIYANKYHQRAGVVVVNDRFEGGQRDMVQVLGNEIRHCSVEERAYVSTENGQDAPRLLGQVRLNKSNGLAPLPGREPGIAIVDLIGHPEMGKPEGDPAYDALGPSTCWNLIYGNQLVRCPRGVEIGKAVSKTVVMGNLFLECPTAIADAGRGTVIEGNTVSPAPAAK